MDQTLASLRRRELRLRRKLTDAVERQAYDPDGLIPARDAHDAASMSLQEARGQIDGPGES